MGAGGRYQRSDHFRAWHKVHSTRQGVIEPLRREGSFHEDQVAILLSTTLHIHVLWPHDDRLKLQTYIHVNLYCRWECSVVWDGRHG
jgi:hypothetical protein